MYFRQRNLTEKIFKDLALGVSSEYYVKLAVLNIRSRDFLLFLGESQYYRGRELRFNKKKKVIWPHPDELL